MESFLPIFARHTKHLMEKIAEQLNLKNNSIFTDDNKCIDIEDIRLFYEDLTLNVINGWPKKVLILICEFEFPFIYSFIYFFFF